MSVLTPNDNARELLTVAEVAVELRCSAPTVRRRIASGELTAVRIGAGGGLRIPRAAMDQLLTPASVLPTKGTSS